METKSVQWWAIVSSPHRPFHMLGEQIFQKTLLGGLKQLPRFNFLTNIRMKMINLKILPNLSGIYRFDRKFNKNYGERCILHVNSAVSTSVRSSVRLLLTPFSQNWLLFSDFLHEVKIQLKNENDGARFLKKMLVMPKINGDFWPKINILNFFLNLFIQLLGNCTWWQALKSEWQWGKFFL